MFWPWWHIKAIGWAFESFVLRPQLQVKWIRISAGWDPGTGILEIFLTDSRLQPRTRGELKQKWSWPHHHSHLPLHKTHPPPTDAVRGYTDIPSERGFYFSIFIVTLYFCVVLISNISYPEMYDRWAISKCIICALPWNNYHWCFCSYPLKQI